MTPPGDKLIIRPARPDDLAAVMAIERESFADPWSAEALFGELHADSMRLPLVAEMGSRVCGFIMTWIVADQLHILNIATAREFLRQGVGTALLQEACRLVAPTEVREMTLEVRRSNHGARDFYRGLGFQECGIRPGYYQDNGEDAIIMTGPCSGLTGR